MLKRTRLTNLRWLNGGYCWQSIYLSGVRSLGFRKFYAVFLELTHPQHGKCLIDTGYGPAVFQATRKFPERALRIVTPIPKRQTIGQNDYLKRQSLCPNDITTIFLSHFHADHIGGLSLFPDSDLVFRKQGLAELSALPRKAQIHNGFIAELLGERFAERSLPIAESNFRPHPEFGIGPFRTFDYWGDGSLIMVDLPGHAQGHTGYLLQTESGPVLYVVDAFWDRRAFDKQHPLPWLSRQLQHSYRDYWRTQAALKTICSSENLTPIACHCPETQRLVSRHG